MRFNIVLSLLCLWISCLLFFISITVKTKMIKIWMNECSSCWILNFQQVLPKWFSYQLVFNIFSFPFGLFLLNLATPPTLMIWINDMVIRNVFLFFFRIMLYQHSSPNYSNYSTLINYNPRKSDLRINLYQNFNYVIK